VYLALKPAGRKKAMFYFFSTVYFAVIGTGYHGTYAFVGDFPKWIALLSPLSIIVITTIVTIALPDNMIGVKSFLTVTGLNLPLAIFYFVATKYLLLERNVEIKFP